MGHPDRSETFSNLGGCLVSRYEQQGESQDLEDALECFRTALSLKPTGHARRDLSLNNLASCLGHRYRLKREAQDLEEAIRCIQETLHLRSLGHPLRSGSLNNLATCLEDRYGDMGDARDLDQAISYNREALEMEILGHPRRIYTLHALSRCLLRRNERANDLSDLEESITLLQGALDLQPTEHAYKAEVMAELASAYLRYAQLSHQSSKADVAWQLYEKAVSHSTANAHTRYDIARKWVSNSRGESRLLAYRKCLELGDRYILVRSSVRSRLKLLSSLSHSGATDAAACAIGLGEVSTAVELLEQGRTLLWSQLGRYRTSLDALQEVDKDLAVKFESLSRKIESSTTYLTSADSQTSHSSSEEEASQYRRLTEEWDATLQRIRSIEGFGTFLRATPFSILRQAAAKGPVIILNISQERSDAIIVRSHHDPVLVPLDQVGPDQVGSLSLEFSEAVLLGSERARRLKINSILRVLWDFIQPVVETLQAIGIPKGSRIWWCPTSKLASLPLHAAGPHRGSKPNLPDIYVCSYTPTLTALITGLRIQKEESTASVNPTLLLVAQPEAPGQAPIQSVIEEIRKVHLVVPSIDLLINERGLHREVISQLQSHRWVHFASHGSQNTKEPFESCFHLHDKPLHLLDIIQAHLPNAEFAFLSACHSAAGSKVTPDETIHLAAGLQFSGFRSVIGTLYAMADIDGPVVAEEVYKYIYRHVLSHGQTKGSLVDFTDAAQGLNIATRVLRQNNVPVERWINFVHIGA
ncbi:hypothetical protein FRC02_008088 [Tulasnella sp. 418]|nr:hypothetical protein FRC02_008088 [Tulasnella sp. 418]